jgi:hypothetical protein
MHHTKWTLVQHTAFSVAGNPAFRLAVEERPVPTRAKQQLIADAGGALFDTLPEAAGDASEVNERIVGVGELADEERFGPRLNGERIYLPAARPTAVAA